MAANSTEILHFFSPMVKTYKDGRFERLTGTEFVPASVDPTTGIQSKDVKISPEIDLSARLYLPGKPNNSPNSKLPLLIYYHGGGFVIESAFCPRYHKHLNHLVAEANIIAVSVNYRLAPEHPIPACYDDSYAVLEWIDSHTRPGQGPDPWLNEYADFDRVFMAGDSAGANIVHNMAIRVKGGEFGLRFSGSIMVHPFFGNGESDNLWDFVCPDTTGPNDVRLNPTADMDLLSKLVCERVLICVGEKDFLRERGWNYYEGLKKSEWNGVVEFFETFEEGHVFHLFDPNCENAVALLTRIVGFIN